MEQRKKLCKKMYKQMSNLLKKILTHKKMFVILLMQLTEVSAKDNDL